MEEVIEKITTLDIECSVASYFNSRVNLIVPNISWGLFLHEVDVLVVTPSNYCYEVEIKTSRSDLVADTKKKHHHNSKKIKKLFFAIPEYLQKDIDKIQENAGILIIERIQIMNDHYDKCKRIREPWINREARKLTEDERYQVARLGTMRIWTLKDTLKRRGIVCPECGLTNGSFTCARCDYSQVSVG